MSQQTKTNSTHRFPRALDFDKSIRLAVQVKPPKDWKAALKEQVGPGKGRRVAKKPKKK